MKGGDLMKQAQFKRPLTIAFRQDMFAKIKQKSDEEKISMAEWVRTAINHYLVGPEKEN